MAVKFVAILVIFYGAFDISFAQRQTAPTTPRRAVLTAQSTCDQLPPSKVTPRECCDIVYIFPNETASKCMSQTKLASNINVGIKGPLDGMECFFACLFNSTNSLGANGQINIATLKQTAATTLTGAGQTKWIPAVNEAIDFCNDLTSRNSQRITQSLKGKQVDGQNICSPVPQFLGSCIYFRMISTCQFKNQQSSQQAQQQCNQLQEFYKKCPTPPLH